MNLENLMVKDIDERNYKIEQLKKDLAQAKEDHQFDNLIHAKEIKEIRKEKKK